jgi:MFS family permease
MFTIQAISPIIGGYTATRLNWQWIFYILTIIGGVLFLLTLFFLQETLERRPLEKKPGSLCANFVSRRRLKTQKGVNAQIFLRRGYHGE